MRSLVAVAALAAALGACQPNSEKTNPAVTTDRSAAERMQGAPDHPMTLTFPEGEYLKGLVVMKSAALGDKAERATITG
jgi:hypothetical protein